ncbi:hypothetical protein D3C87_1803940 [compost metagenome]
MRATVAASCGEFLSSSTTSFTGRPSIPPAACTSSRYRFTPSWKLMPYWAKLPERWEKKPMLTGSAASAEAVTREDSAASSGRE